MHDAPPAVDVVVLNQGIRPEETSRCIASVRAQEGVETRLMIVGNGWRPEGLGDDIDTMHLIENVGIPEGRNRGAADGEAELIFFLDDDAWLPQPDMLRRAHEVFRSDEHLALLQPRISDPNGTTLRRWVPRARVGDPARPGPAFTAAEGASIVRRTAFESVGGFPGLFFYGHEGIELAWRLRDAGWSLWYEPSLSVHHPATQPTRHSTFYRMNARNRVWVARRNLPLPVASAYVFTWAAVTTARTWRDPANLRIWFKGVREGIVEDPGGRRPMRWRTVGQLTRLGQPPVV